MKKLFFVGILVSTMLISLSVPVQAENATQVIINMLLLGDEDTRIKKNIVMQWTRPFQRENDSSLSISDIDHYQIRYRKTGSVLYRFLIIYPPSLTADLTLRGNVGDQYELSIRAIDTSGLASNYTDAVAVAFEVSE